MPLGSVPKTMSGSGAIPDLLCCQGIVFAMSARGEALLADDSPNQRAAMRAEAAGEEEGIEIPNLMSGNMINAALYGADARHQPGGDMA